MTSSTAIRNRCDAAIQVIENLQDATQILVTYEADSNKLKQDIALLRLEKQSLGKEIFDMKQELREIECPNWFVTNLDRDGDDSKCFLESMSEVRDVKTLSSQSDDAECRRKIDRSWVCTSTTPLSSFVKRRGSKWSKSPKKWRRMIRSNRLQSIILFA